MSRSDHTPISALAEFLDELVLGIDDESGVECGKGVSLHGCRWTKSWEGGNIYKMVVQVKAVYDRDQDSVWQC